MKEFGGQKTPLEKNALTSKYYSYLNKPGMYRLPTKFFDNYPIYMNMANMIPYYSFNMFNPSQTNFQTETLPTELVSYFQKSPIMKDPFGSVAFDYLIQPLILGETVAPQGQFGQAIYPRGASAGTKALFAAKTLGETIFVPNIFSYAGLVTPESWAEYSPGYSWKSLARAKYGQNPVGVTGKEHSGVRTFRNLARMSGIPIQAGVDLSFATREAKQQ